MKQPFAPATRMFAADSTAYTYESITGQLALVRDPAGNLFRYAYDTVGRVVKQVARSGTADSIRVATTYDAESERIAYNGETASYDARGKMYPSSDSLVYAPLGALKYSNNGSVIESYDPDVLGNSWRTDVSGPDLPVTQPKFAKYWAGGGQLIQETRVNGRWMDTTNHVYNGLNGALQQTDVKTVADTVGGFGGGNSRWQHKTTNNHYDKQAQLDSTQYIVDTIPFSAGHQYTDYMAVEMYRYDALNRRVWMRNIRGVNCSKQDKSSGCRSNLRRTIWDGDQILYEIQVKGDSASTFLESDSYTSAPFGTIAYTHGIGLDAPLALYKDYKSTMVTPAQDLSGKFIGGSCHPSACNALQIYWPEEAGSQFSILGTAPLGPPSWYGSIIEAQQDASGYQYKRNRYYDPQTGKFTQEDPIGLAGGLNAYGFAGGDPVNYSDPFGLCPVTKEDPTPCPEKGLDDVSTDFLFFAGGIEVKGAEALEEGGVKLVSKIGESPALKRIAAKLEGEVQGAVDRLTEQLAKGNKNPGIGSKHLFGNVFEARARNGARVYFRNAGEKVVEILAKSSKETQEAVIRALQQLYK